MLILCTGNSARSILGEAILNALGEGRFRASSAGSQPTGQVNPAALRQLEVSGHSTSGLRSKSWEEFWGENAAPIDLVITVCDSAASESCPMWAGDPISVHWRIPDPAAVGGDEEVMQKAYEETYRALRQRFDLLVELPFEHLSDDVIRSALKSISRCN